MEIFLTVLLLGGCASSLTGEKLAEEYYNLGNAYYELGEYEKSYQYYSRARQLDPRVQASSFNLARLYIDWEDYDEALEILRELTENVPDNVVVQETLAYTLYLNGQIEESLTIYGAIAADYPARSSVIFNFISISSEVGEYDAAIPVLDAALTLLPDDEELIWIASDTYFHAGREESALNALETYRAMVGENEENLVAIAERYYEWEYYLPAIEIFEEAKEGRELPPLSLVHLAGAYMIATDNFMEGAGMIENIDTGALEEGTWDLVLSEIFLIGESLSEDEANYLNSIVESLESDRNLVLSEGVEGATSPEAP